MIYVVKYFINFFSQNALYYAYTSKREFFKMKIDTLKEYCAKYSAAQAAKQLNVLAQQVHDTIRKNVPVFVEHENGAITNCYLKKKWGKL